MKGKYRDPVRVWEKREATTQHGAKERAEGPPSKYVVKMENELFYSHYILS